MAKPKNELIAEQQLQTLNQKSQKNKLQTLTAEELQSVIGGLTEEIYLPGGSKSVNLFWCNIPFEQFVCHFRS